MTLAGLMLCVMVHAQSKHEFSIYVGGGLSPLNYSASVGEQKQGFGGLAGLGYQFFFSPNWSIGTGAELSLYNSTFKLNDLLVKERVFDIENEIFEFKSRMSNYKEQQTSVFLQIPLMLQFQTGGKHRFYMAAGGKVGIPVIKTYKSTDATLQNSGYYSYESYTYTTQTFLGFGTFTGRGSEGDFDFKMAFFASAETGIKWRLSSNISLYSGVYLDYGLNNVVNKQASPFIDYAGNLKLNSILHATYRDSRNQLQRYVDKVTPLSMGIKVRLAFGSGGRKTVRKAVATPVVFTPPAIVDVEETVREQTEEVVVCLDTVKNEIRQPIGHYNQMQTGLDYFQEQILDRKIVLLQQCSELKVFIYGHTCGIGTEKSNETIGLQRAEYVKAYMISKGIAEERILGVVSKRNTNPILPDTSEENRKINRRVEIVPE